jgi:hypothetical protein
MVEIFNIFRRFFVFIKKIMYIFGSMRNRILLNVENLLNIHLMMLLQLLLIKIYFIKILEEKPLN